MKYLAGNYIEYKQLVEKIAIRLSFARDVLGLKTFEEYRAKVIEEYLILMKESDNAITDGWSAEIYKRYDFDCVTETIWNDIDTSPTEYQIDR